MYTGAAVITANNMMTLQTFWESVSAKQIWLLTEMSL